jgi:hypothetical protein
VKRKLSGKPGIRQTRADAGLRLRALLSDAGLSVMQTAKLFQVTPRTVHNWRAGSTRAPGAVVRLVRLMAGRELAVVGWEGWRFHSGKLWTPEGHRIEPQDGSWWSLLVRQARGFRAAYAELHQLRCELARAWKAGYLEPLPVGAADVHAERAFGGAAAGLVPSINNVNTGGEAAAEVQGNQGLACSTAELHTRYQIDHGMTSCPTPSDFHQNSIQRPANGVSAWGSASMPSSPSPLMPTCEALPVGESNGSQQGRPKLKGRASARAKVVNSRSKTSRAGVSSTLTPICGPMLIPTSKAIRSSRGTQATTKRAWQLSKPSTGARASVPQADREEVLS